MSDHLTFQRTPSQFALLIAVPAEVIAWLVADSLPPEKMYIPLGASFVVPAWADAAIKQSRRSLSAITSQDFIGGMMTESASPVRQSLRIIEIRSFKGGSQCHEGRDVGPCWIGDTAKKDAISYATARAKFGRGEISVLSKDGSVETAIAFDETTNPM